MTVSLNFIHQHLVEVDFDVITTVAPKTCRSLEELIEIYKKDMTVTESFIDCLTIILAVHISTAIDGDPLWIYLVGPASSGKSTLCELLCADEIHTKPLSKITGLVSGHSQGTHLLPLMKNKCVVVKDGTLLLESGQQQLTELFGEFRDIYDGGLEAHYRNGVGAVSFSGITFSMVIGITERVYSLNMAALGERFLHCRLESTRATEQRRNRSAITQVWEDSSKVTEDSSDHRSFPLQRQYTAGFLGHLHTRLRDEEVLRPAYEPEDLELVQALADIIACSRAQAAKDKREEILYETRPESATRVCKVLARLALLLCYVLNVTRITDRVKYLLVKKTLDSAHGRQYSILRAITLSTQGMTRQGLAQKVGIPLTSCSRILDDLISLSVIEKTRETNRKSSGMGNDFLSCPDWITNAFRLAEKYETDKGSTTKKPAVINKARPIRKKKKKSTSKR